MTAPEWHKITRICAGCGQPFEATKELHRRKCNDCVHKERQLEHDDELAKIETDKQAAFKLMCRRASIPSKWVNVTFDNTIHVANKKAMAIAREYAETFTRDSGVIVFFSNGYGTGKTHLAACIANHVLNNLRRQVIFKKARDLMLNLRATYRDDGTESEAQIFREVLGAELLVLDDVGIDTPSQWLEQTYWTVFDRRMEWNLPMVITTNYPLEAGGDAVSLGDRIGYRALSRMREMTQGRFIHIAEKDLR